ncbi:MAG: iron-sulfur cluster assembly scaffold protein [Chitinispirillaceae bacterium]|nr:iron-sulfur cluster assembly scaffold protein [Chitinispirillaceae bacterium]
MTISTLLLTILAMTLIAVAWIAAHYYLNPRIKNPDGYAKFTGSCGDTMEIALKFNGPCVADTFYWTNGCSISKMCIATAAVLARGKTVPELRAIDRSTIQEKVGSLPDTHVHCAILAETVLQMAVENYVRKSQVNACDETPPYLSKLPVIGCMRGP